MFSIRPSGVPEYLKSSAFFANLSEDNEEVSVPKDCCKLDTSITNAADLDELLRTLRFWGVDRIPESVVNFALLNPRVDWEDAITMLARDLPYLEDLLRVLSCDDACQVCEATEIGNVDLLVPLLKQQKAVQCKPYLFSDNYFNRAVDIAARKGSLEILKILQQFNCSFHDSTGQAAALAGQFAYLQFVMQNGCPVTQDLADYAFVGGSLECLKYVRETLACPWTNTLFRELGYRFSGAQCNEQGMLQCLQYAQEHGCPDDPEACEMRAIHGLLLILEHLHERGVPMGEEVITAAVRNGHLPCLKYAVEHGCPQPNNLLAKAMLSGSIEIVQFLHDMGLPWPNNILREFELEDESEQLLNNCKVCLSHAYKLGCPRDPDSAYYASTHGWYDILVDAHQHGCKMDKYCAMNAASNGHLDCLMYLHENGCPWNEETVIDALQDKQYACAKYAVEHGCPATTATMEKYKELVTVGIL